MGAAALRLLGRPSIDWEGRTWPLAPERRHQLFAWLAQRRAWVARTELAALLWPEQPARLANANVRKTLFRLQELPWGGCLQSQGPSLRVEIATDLSALEDALRAGDVLAGPRYEELLAGFDDASEPWTQWLGFERERLQGQWRTACIAQLEAGTIPAREAADLAAHLLVLDPGDERALLLLMRAHADQGDPERARAAYAAFAERLWRDFSLLPGPELQAAHEQFHVRAAPSPPAPRPATPLPVDAGFIGRTVELHQIAQWLADPAQRVVSIVGPGGAGKTRLASRALRELAPRHPDGAWFVALEDAPPDADLAAEILRTLRVPLAGSTDPGATLAKHLADRRVLLVLDNFEHLVHGSTHLGALLRTAPHWQAIVTTRTRPAVAPQVSLALEGLPRPDEEDGDRLEAFDAVRLFVQAARAVEPAFTPSAEAEALIEICRLVDGLPLALEIAGAWTRVLSCAAIASELRHGTELLSARDPARAPRHASIEVVFDQSWNLLTAAEREALARLSIFRGGFTSTAARSVAQAPLPVLGALVDKSLVRKGGARLHVHPLLQQLAAQRLAGRESATATEAAHAAHYLQLLAALRRPSEKAERTALDEVEVEFDNVRKAFAWAAAHGRTDLLAPAAATLRNYCDHRGRWPEGAELLRNAIELGPSGSRPIQPLLRSALAHLLYRQDRYVDAIATAEDALASAPDDDHETRLQCFKTLGASTFRLDRLDDASRFYGEALRLAPGTADPRTAAAMLDNLSLIEKRRGRRESALAMSQRALAQFRAVIDVGGEALCLNNLGDLLMTMGDVDAARTHLEQALEVCDRHQLTSTRAIVLANLTEVGVLAGDHAAAKWAGERAIELARNVGNRPLESAVRLQYVEMARRDGEAAAAREHLRQALELVLAVGRPVLLAEAVRALAKLLEAAGEAGAASRVRQVVETPARAAEVRTLAERALVESGTGYTALITELNTPSPPGRGRGLG